MDRIFKQDWTDDQSDLFIEGSDLASFFQRKISDYTLNDQLSLNKVRKLMCERGDEIFFAVGDLLALASLVREGDNKAKWKGVEWLWRGLVTAEISHFLLERYHSQIKKQRGKGIDDDSVFAAWIASLTHQLAPSCAAWSELCGNAELQLTKEALRDIKLRTEHRRKVTAALTEKAMKVAKNPSLVIENRQKMTSVLFNNEGFASLEQDSVVTYIEDRVKDENMYPFAQDVEGLWTVSDYLSNISTINTPKHTDRHRVEVAECIKGIQEEELRRRKQEKEESRRETMPQALAVILACDFFSCIANIPPKDIEEKIEAETIWLIHRFKNDPLLQELSSKEDGSQRQGILTDIDQISNALKWGIKTQKKDYVNLFQQTCPLKLKREIELLIK